MTYTYASRVLEGLDSTLIVDNNTYYIEIESVFAFVELDEYVKGDRENEPCLDYSYCGYEDLEMNLYKNDELIELEENVKDEIMDEVDKIISHEINKKDFEIDDFYEVNYKVC